MYDLIADAVDAVLLAHVGWVECGVWRDKDGVLDPDGRSSFTVDGPTFWMRDSEDREIMGRESAILAVRVR